MRISLTLCVTSIAIIVFTTSCYPQSNTPPAPTPIPDSTSTPLPDPSPTVIPVIDPVIDTIQGSFRNQIGILEENMPRSNSEGFVIPTKKEQADFANLVSMLGAQNLTSAVQLATQNDYTLTYYEDRGDEHAVSYLLRENKPIQKGWGLYAFRLNSTSNIIIEAPHPLYDRRTPSVALDIYRALDARALLIAGAHRNSNSDGSADVAHTTESIFHSVHDALSQEIQAVSGDVIILQIHGFHTSKHEGYPQVVFGFGKNAQAKEVALAERIMGALSDQGITSGQCAGGDLQDLCAKTNVQGSMNDILFIHIELDEKLRRNDDQLVAALIQVFGK